MVCVFTSNDSMPVSIRSTYLQSKETRDPEALHHRELENALAISLGLSWFAVHPQALCPPPPPPQECQDGGLRLKWAQGSCWVIQKLKLWSQEARASGSGWHTC